MSLEALLAENTAAVKAQTEATVALTEITQRLYDLRSTTVDEIKAAAAGAKAPAKAAAKKPEETPAGAASTAEAATGNTDGAATTQPAADATNRLAEVQKVCAQYAGSTDREDERTARKEKLTWLFGKVGATKLAEIPAGKEAAVIKAVTQLIADGDLTTAPETETPAASDDDLLAT